MSYKLPLEHALEVHASPRLKSIFAKNKKCNSVEEMWGMVWASFETLLDEEMQSGDQKLKKTRWKFLKEYKIEKDLSHIFLLNIKNSPDIHGNVIDLEYTEKDELIQNIQQRIKNYGMNQYFKAIPLKYSIHQDKPMDVKFQSTHIPTYYQYEFGKKIRNDIEYNLIVFTIHIPFMSFDVDQYPVILFDIGIYLPIGIIDCQLFQDTLYDLINKIIFNYQINQFVHGNGLASTNIVQEIDELIEKIDEFIELTINKKDYGFPMKFQTIEDPQKQNEEESISPIETSESKQSDIVSTLHTNSQIQRTRFVSAMISAYMKTYFTICIPSSIDEMHDIYSLLNIFSTSSQRDLHSNNLTIKINPFFTLQFITQLEPFDYFTFPYPISIIDITTHSIKAMKDVSLHQYYSSRKAYFVNLIQKQICKQITFPITQANGLVNPITFLIPIEYELSIYETIAHFISLTDKRNYGQAKYLLHELKYVIFYKARKIYEYTIGWDIQFNQKLIENLELCLDLNKNDIMFYISMLKFDQPSIANTLYDCVMRIVKQEEDIKKSFMY